MDLQFIKNGFNLVGVDYNENFKNEIKTYRGNYLPLEWGYKG